MEDKWTVLKNSFLTVSKLQTISLELRTNLEINNISYVYNNDEQLLKVLFSSNY